MFYYEQGEYFCDFCVCVCMCKYALGPLSQCTFLLKTQLALSAKVIKWSFIITQLFILDTRKNKPKATFDIYLPILLFIIIIM